MRSKPCANLRLLLRRKAADAAHAPCLVLNPALPLGRMPGSSLDLPGYVSCVPILDKDTRRAAPMPSTLQDGTDLPQGKKAACKGPPQPELLRCIRIGAACGLPTVISQQVRVPPALMPGLNDDCVYFHLPCIHLLCPPSLPHSCG